MSGGDGVYCKKLRAVSEHDGHGPEEEIAKADAGMLEDAGAAAQDADISAAHAATSMLWPARIELDRARLTFYSLSAAERTQRRRH